MGNIVICLEKTLDYIEGVLSENELIDKFTDKLCEQRENLNDFKKMLNQYTDEVLTYTSYEPIESDETLNKLMTVHKFLTDIDWHISEINELKDEVVKLCSSKRE